MIEIRLITAENAGDLSLKNEPFVMPGQMIPQLTNGVWSHEIRYYDVPQSMVFPEEQYSLAALDKESAFALGAYLDGKCAGLVIVKPSFAKYMHVYDLKVSAACRGQGIGCKLMDAALQQAKQRGFRGLYLQAQDNNLNACLFYLKIGFAIGGFDNRVYTGTSQEGKADIIFYKD